MTDWISVEDELPQFGQPVTYWFTPFNQEYDGWYLGTDDGLIGFGGRHGFNYGPEVTHWKPRKVINAS